MIYKKALEEYVQVEQEAHVFNSASIVNKVTQELLELKKGKRNNDLQNVEEETRDAIVNILSATYKTGILPDELLLSRNLHISGDDIDDALSSWNEDIQGYNKDYSRNEVSPRMLKTSTEGLLSAILSFGNSQETLENILKHNTEKFRARIPNYRPNIDLDEYVDNLPFKGVPFKDIKKLLMSPEAMKYVIFELVRMCKGSDAVVGLDARGFIFGREVAGILGIPFVMARKPKKLPGGFDQIEYTLEYEKDVKHYLEMQHNTIQPGWKVAIIDDVIATGGSAKGTTKLIEGFGGEVSIIAAVLGLDYCEWNKELNGYNVKAIKHYSVPANIQI